LFENLLIPLPPLSEQKKIAYVLSTVQEAKEKTEDVIKATKELKKSMMKYLFTYGPVSLEEVEKVPLKETEIGLIPEEWEMNTFGNVGTFQYGYTESANKKEVGPKFLRITDINLGTNIINWATVPYCKIEEDRFAYYSLNEGDILIARIGATTGKTCIIKNPPKSVFASYLIRFISNRDIIDPNFLFYYTEDYKYWRQIDAGKEGKLKKGVSSSQLKKFLLPVPSLLTQKKIASILSVIDQKIEAEENKKKALEDLFKSLLHNLMTAKIRVNHLENVFDE
jgi:type I restriction enzyme S subunit